VNRQNAFETMRKYNTSEYLVVPATRLLGRSLQLADKAQNIGAPQSRKNFLFVGRCAPATVQAPFACYVADRPVGRYVGGNMFAHTRIQRRLLGFDIGDWSIILVGFALVALLTLLV
jgi:hypothetical protein